MKDVTGILQTQVFRLLVIYILPGGLVVIPYYRILPFLYPKLLILVPNNDVLRGIALFCAATFVGMVLEDLGSRIERRWDNRDRNILDCWYTYLCLKFDREPVAVHYIAGVQMRLKFELSACCATILAAIPVVPFLCARTSIGFAVLTAIAALILAWYLMFEARSSHEVLHKVRVKLCEIYTPTAPATAANPIPAPAKPAPKRPKAKRPAKKRSASR